MVDVKCLSDDELQHELDKLGFSPGPVLSSTRKLYENKLIQLLVSPPCASPPVKNEPGEQDGAQGCDDNKELNAIVIVKGNITVASEKNKGPKKRSKASTAKAKAQDTDGLSPKCSEKVREKKREGERRRETYISCLPSALNWGCCPQPRGASRAPDSRPKGRSDAEEKDCRAINCSVGGRDLEKFPVGVKLAAFVIFVIVIFVYITVEKKPLLG
ncbi:LEM domain containing 1 [Phyllostomus discolor]|uniref:LEM domain containing 1 n=1 Tax=Phyllostomus discolor TaxID=89673 RepID=A0A834DDE4_9CHIR|nr:LEM domain containing 1 [Phyllostomus discolor]